MQALVRQKNREFCKNNSDKNWLWRAKRNLGTSPLAMQYTHAKRFC